MGKQTEIKQSPTSIHVKPEQFQRRSSPRKRPAPKIEEEIVEDIVVDDGPIPETHHEGTVEEKKEEIEFVKGCTNRGFVCIWHKG